MKKANQVEREKREDSENSENERHKPPRIVADNVATVQNAVPRRYLGDTPLGKPEGFTDPCRLVIGVTFGDRCRLLIGLLIADRCRFCPVTMCRYCRLCFTTQRVSNVSSCRLGGASERVGANESTT